MCLLQTLYLAHQIDTDTRTSMEAAICVERIRLKVANVGGYLWDVDTVEGNAARVEFCHRQVKEAKAYAYGD